MSSFYDVILRCDKFNENAGGLWEFWLLDNEGPVGYMPPELVTRIRWGGSGFQVARSERRVYLTPIVAPDDNIIDACRYHFVRLCERNVGVIEGMASWLERKVDYHPIRGLDRHLAGLAVPSPLRGVLGIVTTGVHLNVYTVKRVDGRPSMHVWVSKRSQNVTYAGKLDQIVAGAMDQTDDMDPLRTLKREAMEEARLTVDISSLGVSTNGVLVGVLAKGRDISFYDQKDTTAGSEEGQLEPGVRFTFDLEVDERFVPQPGEPHAIAGFFLKPVDDIKRDLKEAKWKPNCGLVMLDFLLRQQQINPGEDENYMLLWRGLQRRLPFRSV
ncbi:hypothetical protein RJ55_05671 [Drechmeria coniospora]|nr:hypothetical protein RJ55_05671 [Drechmeria coniospora]